MPEAQELLSKLRSMRNDPALRDFQPVIDEMISGIEVPDYDNIEIILDLFFRNDLQYHCNQLADILHYRSAMTMHRKKWYELDD